MINYPYTEEIDTRNPLILHKNLEDGVKSKELPMNFEEKKEFKELMLQDTYRERDFSEFKKKRVDSANG